MSLSRINSPAEWFCKPGYVYITKGKVAEYQFNHPIREPEHFCELAMRALEQSGEVDEETLEECAQALESRFSFAGVEYE
jgi:hypothetical protein